MTSKHLVDPALLGILDAYPRGQFSNDTMPQIRESRRLALAAMRKPEDSAAAAVIVEERSVPGAPGSPDVRLLIFRQGGGQNARQRRAPTCCSIRARRRLYSRWARYGAGKSSQKSG